MPKYYYILITLFFIGISNTYGQTLLNNDKQTGKINNKGTITIRNAGSIVGMPDTINGRVEFISNKKGNQQIIPNVVYNQLLIKGVTPKYADSSWLSNGKNPLITRDSLIISDEALFYVDTVEVHAKASITNTAKVTGRRDVRLKADNSTQDIIGNGTYSNLNLDNPLGADVKGGGFRIQSKLELTRGELRNDEQNNFKMEDSAWIVRHNAGYLQNAPEFDTTINIEYKGNSQIVSGYEIPKDSSKLHILKVHNTGGLVLDNNIQVNDSIIISDNIYTDFNSSNTYTLTYNSEKNPVFENIYAEIDGSMRRTKLKANDTLRFNNYYTYAVFPDIISMAEATELTFRIKPYTYPLDDIQKVMRWISISAKDINGKSIDRGIKMNLGYAWRHSDTSDALDETKSLKPQFDELVLQKWGSNDWIDLNSSIPQIQNTWAFSWATASSDDVYSTGEFAIGLASGSRLVLNAKVFLEGPYRCGSMAMDLYNSARIPLQSPYSNDIIQVTQIPDSVIDWIQLEFRSDFTGSNRYYKTCFVRYDGRIVDLDGKSSVVLSKNKIDKGDYYIVVHHRNHLSIITNSLIPVYPETVANTLDFTNPKILMGEYSSVKQIAQIDGQFIYAMFAGDVNNDGIIDENDDDSFLKAMYQKNYNQNDNNLDGIVTTRDLNVSNNNRDKKSAVTK